MKRIKRIIIAGIVVVVIAIAGAVFWIDHLAKAGIEVGGTYALGTKTAVDSASIGILSGQSRIAGLQVSNPPGFQSDYFLKLGQGGVAVSLASLTGDLIEVPELALTGIEVNLEKKIGGANYKTIMDNLGRFESKDRPAEQSEGKKFVVRDLVLRDVKVHVNLVPPIGAATTVTVPINELRLRDVGTGSSKGVVIAQLVDVILKAILESALQNGGGLLPGEVLADLTSGLKGLESLKNVGATLASGVEGNLKDLQQQAGQAAKNAEATASEAAKKAQDAARNTASEVTGGLKNLIKKPEPKPSR